VRRSQKHKKYCQVVSLFCPSGICLRKSFSKNVGEIDPWLLFLSLPSKSISLSLSPLRFFFTSIFFGGLSIYYSIFWIFSICFDIFPKSINFLVSFLGDLAMLPIPLRVLKLQTQHVPLTVL